MSVWIPSEKCLIVGDVVGTEFPNMFPLAGFNVRIDLMKWVSSVRKLLWNLPNPKHLLSSTNSIIGDELKTRQTMTQFADALQFVHDQTVRLLNDGYEVDEVVDIMKRKALPISGDLLAYTKGDLEWAVRGVVNFYLGWFSGYIDELFPLTHSKKLKYLNELLSGKYRKRGWVRMYNRARIGLYRSSRQSKNKNGTANLDELTWSLQLSMWAAEISGAKKAIKLTNQVIDALIQARGRNKLAKNVYTFYANRCLLEKKIVYFNANKNLPTDQLLKVLPLRFRAENCDLNLVIKVFFELSDGEHMEEAVFVLRNCVVEKIDAELNTGAYNLHMQTTSDVFRKVLMRKINVDALSSLQVVFKSGTVDDLKLFLSFFDP